MSVWVLMGGQFLAAMCLLHTQGCCHLYSAHSSKPELLGVSVVQHSEVVATSNVLYRPLCFRSVQSSKPLACTHINTHIHTHHTHNTHTHAPHTTHTYTPHTHTHTQHTHTHNTHTTHTHNNPHTHTHTHTHIQHTWRGGHSTLHMPTMQWPMACNTHNYNYFDDMMLTCHSINIQHTHAHIKQAIANLDATTLWGIVLASGAACNSFSSRLCMMHDWGAGFSCIFVLSMKKKIKYSMWCMYSMCRVFL